MRYYDEVSNYTSHSKLPTYNKIQGRTANIYYLAETWWRRKGKTFT